MNALVTLLILVPAILMADVRETVEQLASLGSRVTGYAGNERAADYIEQRFQALGLAAHRDTLSVVVPLDRGGRAADAGFVLRGHRCQTGSVRGD